MAENKIELSKVTIDDLMDKSFWISNPDGTASTGLQDSGGVLNLNTPSDALQNIQMYKCTKDSTGLTAVFGFSKDTDPESKTYGQFVQNKIALATLIPAPSDVKGTDLVLHMSNINGENNILRDIWQNKPVSGGSKDKHSQAIALIQAIAHYIGNYNFISVDVNNPSYAHILDGLVQPTSTPEPDPEPTPGSNSASISNSGSASTSVKSQSESMSASASLSKSESVSESGSTSKSDSESTSVSKSKK